MIKRQDDKFHKAQYGGAAVEVALLLGLIGLLYFTAGAGLTDSIFRVFNSSASDSADSLEAFPKVDAPDPPDPPAPAPNASSS